MKKYKTLNIPELPLLDEEETKSLIKKAQNGNEKALDRLVRHNLRLVLKIAHRYKNSQVAFPDLFQIGVVGLIKAIKGFELERNVKFSTYAFSRIMGEIRLFLRDKGSVKVSRSLKKIARILRKKREELKKKLNREPTLKELEKETGLDREKIVRALEAVQNPTSLYKTINKGEEKGLRLIDNLAQEVKGEFSREEKLNLQECLKNLDPRSRRIIYLRYFEDKTQQEIGEEIGVSQVQVSRLEKKILNRLAADMKGKTE